MELRVLQYFLAVAREQNISAAAQSLHLTQPTLSRQLKELEEELGKQLMIRGNRKITLTEDGMLLRKRAEEILDLVGRTEKEIAQSDETISGDIYIGTGETDGVRQIARTAHQLQQRYPGILFHIVSGDAVDVCERLDKGLLDFGILLGDIDKTKYHYTELPMKDTWGVLMRRSSPLAEKEAVSPRDLWDKPLILSRQVDNKSGLYRWLGKDPTELHTVATYNLIYNASLMWTREWAMPSLWISWSTRPAAVCASVPCTPNWNWGCIWCGKNPRSSPGLWSCFWNSSAKI